jgi:hypothetical protein
MAVCMERIICDTLIALLMFDFFNGEWVKVFNDTVCIVHPALTYNF